MSWDSTSPVDSTLIADIPSSIRSVQAAILADSTMSASDSLTPVTEKAITQYITGTAITMSNKTISSPVLITPQIDDSNSSHQYIVGVANLSADQSTAYPLLSAADTFVFANHAATLKNKTISTPTLQGACVGSVNFSASAVNSVAISANSVNSAALSSASVGSAKVSKIFGAWSARVSDAEAGNVQSASTDGLVVAIGPAGGDMEGQTPDGSSRIQTNTTSPGQPCFVMPVRGGDTWHVLGAENSSIIYWLPIGV